MGLNLGTKKQTQQEEATAVPLAVKYRPKALEDVIGQEGVVKSLNNPKRHAKAFVFAGPSGCGKTTLARIIAKGSILEVDAATHTGIDAMREVTELAKHRDIMDPSGRRTVIVDEAHRLSKQTWDSLLKSVEEPPEHLQWIFCTTEKSKIPATILSRCEVYNLRPVESKTIASRLKVIAKREKISVDDEIITLAADMARGNLRQAISFLGTLDGVEDKDQAIRMMQAAEEQPEVIDFIRYVVWDRNRNWAGVQKRLQALKEQEQEAESIRIVMVNYLASCILGAKTDRDAARLMAILAQFSTPYPTTDKYGPLLLSLGNLIF